MMNWEEIYLTCFLVGFLMSLLALVAHSIDFHLPGQQADLPQLDHAHDGGGFSKFNFVTLSAFLAWFGGTGYLLERHSGFGLLLALGLAVVSGVIGASVVFFLIAKVLLRHERDLDPADFNMVGVLGKVSSAVREGGGIGEMIFSQNDARRAAPIRAEDGTSAIPRDTEVVVTRYERGVAYVRRWEEFSGMQE